MSAKKRTTQRVVSLIEVRRLVADYIGSEGCDCCRGAAHPEHQTALAKLLKVKPYSDDSGHNFGAYSTPTPAKET